MKTLIVLGVVTLALIVVIGVDMKKQLKKVVEKLDM